MPFDATPEIDNPLTFSPGREGLRKLAYVLRHRELWPDGHKWHFGSCTKCAMGIANEIWPSADFIGDRLGLTCLQAGQLFGIGSYPKATENVMPEDVADRIEYWLATGRV